MNLDVARAAKVHAWVECRCGARPGLPDPRDADPLYVEEDGPTFAEVEQLWRDYFAPGWFVALILAGISGFLMGAALMWILR